MGVAYATAGMNTGVRYAMTNLGRLADPHEGDAGRRRQPARQLVRLHDVVHVRVADALAAGLSPFSSRARRAASSRAISTSASSTRTSSTVLYTLYTAYGGTAPTFGMDEGQVSSGIPELLA